VEPDTSVTTLDAIGAEGKVVILETVDPVFNSTGTDSKLVEPETVSLLEVDEKLWFCRHTHSKQSSEC